MIDQVLTIFPVIFPFIALFIIPVLFLSCFLFYHLVISIGFKFLNIKNVERQRITVFIFILIIYSIFDPVINLLYEIVQVKFLYIVDYLVSSCFVFFLFKYYFNLTGKKLWQFFIYFIFVNFIIYYLVVAILGRL